jgi:hypothetical protein
MAVRINKAFNIKTSITALVEMPAKMLLLIPNVCAKIYPGVQNPLDVKLLTGLEIKKESTLELINFQSFR